MRDLAHAGGRLGQHQVPQVVDERQPQQAGPGPDLDRPRRVAQVDGVADRRGDGPGALPPLVGVPVPRPLVERGHVGP